MSLFSSSFFLLALLLPLLLLLINRPWNISSLPISVFFPFSLCVSRSIYCYYLPPLFLLLFSSSLFHFHPNMQVLFFLTFPSLPPSLPPLPHFGNNALKSVLSCTVSFGKTVAQSTFGLTVSFPPPLPPPLPRSTNPFSMIHSKLSLKFDDVPN